MKTGIVSTALDLSRKILLVLKQTVLGFLGDDALSHGAAIAYYTVFAMAPVLVIVIAVAGLAFGHDAAQGAIVQQLSGLMGHEAAGALQAMIRSASDRRSGTIATILGFVMLLVTASGVFGQMQKALNIVWNASPARTGVSRLVKARLQSLGLVVTLGFLLMVSLLASAAVSALGSWLNGILPGLSAFMQVLGFLVSFGLVAALFGAIYKVLPDRQMEWRDVIIGAIATAFLFNVGKQAIALYIGSSRAATAYGAAAAFVIVLLWIYYSAQIFLLGAEFTKAYTEVFGSQSGGSLSEPTAETTPPVEAGPKAIV